MITPTGSPAQVRTDRPISSWSRNSSGSPVSGSWLESTLSQLPVSSAAAVRSVIPANATSSCPECQRAEATLSGWPALPSSGRSSSGEFRASTVAPTANRRSGSSVLTPITTSPRIPCGQPTRPTTIRIGSADLVGVQQVDPDVAARRQGADHRTQRPGGAPAPADDLAEVIGMHPHLEDATPAQRPAGDLNIIRILDDAPDQVLEGFLKHVRLRSPARRPPRRPWWPARRPRPS